MLIRIKEIKVKRMIINDLKGCNMMRHISVFAHPLLLLPPPPPPPPQSKSL
jgi:hypothetical protein